MALKAPQGNGGGKQFAPQANIEAGTYPARLVQLIDFGLQPQRPYQGKDKPPAHEIGLTYELVDEFMKDEKGNDIEDKPRWVSETLPFHGLYADKAKSTQRYKVFDPDEAWKGDFAQAVGLPCNVTIVNNKVGDKVYDNVATISAMRPRDAEKCPELVNKATVFDLDNPDLEVFNRFPKWIQEKIQGNLNFKGSKLEKLLGGKKEEKAPEREDPPFDPDELEDNTPY
jgi:hypothetical protein